MAREGRGTIHISCSISFLSMNFWLSAPCYPQKISALSQIATTRENASCAVHWSNMHTPQNRSSTLSSFLHKRLISNRPQLKMRRSNRRLLHSQSIKQQERFHTHHAETSTPLVRLLKKKCRTLLKWRCIVVHNLRKTHHIHLGYMHRNNSGWLCLVTNISSWQKSYYLFEILFDCYNHVLTPSYVGLLTQDLLYIYLHNQRYCSLKTS